MVRHVQPGDKWTPPTAADQNAIADSAEEYMRRRRLFLPGRPGKVTLPTDIVMVRNSSGSTRLAGDVLALTDGLSTPTIDKDNIWFNNTSGPVGFRYDQFCVLKQQLRQGDWGEAHVSGMCIARVNLSAASVVTLPYSDRAYATPNQYYLTQDETGPIEILWRPSGVSGIQDCVVDLGTEYLNRYLPLSFTDTVAAGGNVNFTVNGVLGAYFGAMFDLTNVGLNWVAPKVDGVYDISFACTVKSTAAPDGASLILDVAVDGATSADYPRGAREQMIRYDTYGAVAQYSAENVADSMPVYLTAGQQVSLVNSSAYEVILTHGRFSMDFQGRQPAI